jgi:serine protease Do
MNLRDTLGRNVFAGAALVAVAALSLPTLLHEEPVSAQTPEAVSALNSLSDAFAAVSEKSAPAVVHIEVDKEMRGGRGMGPEGAIPEDFFEFFFGPRRGMPPGHGQGRGPRPEPESQGPVPYGQGSGFIISADGYIVTNHHVVGDADRVRVVLNDGRKFDAKTIGSDPQTEIALIKIESENLPTIELGDSDTIRVGQWVVAIGSPFGLDHSVTAGIISARGRSNVNIVDYADFIQTDAAINPGNSGGPLINLEGKVVGLNTAIYSRSGGYMGIGFAIPVNMVKYIVDQLRDHGSIERGFIGVGIQNLTDEMAKWFGNGDLKGILVSEVAPDSPGAKAGIQRDDIIVELDGQPVTEVGSFRSRVASTRPGTDVRIGILRGGERSDVTVTLGKLDGEAAGATAEEAASQSRVGLGIQDLTPELAERFGFKDEQGVVITEVEPGSSAARAGLEPGTLITEVNRKPIASVGDYKAAVKESDQKGVLLRVREGEMSRYVVLEAQ